MGGVDTIDSQWRGVGRVGWSVCWGLYHTHKLLSFYEMAWRGVVKSHLSLSLSNKRMSTLTGLFFVCVQCPVCFLTDRWGDGRSDEGGGRKLVWMSLCKCPQSSDGSNCHSYHLGVRLSLQIKKRREGMIMTSAKLTGYEWIQRRSQLIINGPMI